MNECMNDRTRKGHGRINGIKEEARKEQQKSCMEVPMQFCCDGWPYVHACADACVCMCVSVYDEPHRHIHPETHTCTYIQIFVPNCGRQASKQAGRVGTHVGM